MIPLNGSQTSIVPSGEGTRTKLNLKFCLHKMGHHGVELRRRSHKGGEAWVYLSFPVLE